MEDNCVHTVVNFFLSFTFLAKPMCTELMNQQQRACESLFSLCKHYFRKKPSNLQTSSVQYGRANFGKKSQQSFAPERRISKITWLSSSKLWLRGCQCVSKISHAHRSISWCASCRADLPCKALSKKIRFNRSIWSFQIASTNSCYFEKKTRKCSVLLIKK